MAHEAFFRWQTERRILDRNRVKAFADQLELLNKKWRKGSILVGTGHPKRSPLRTTVGIADDRHIFTVAGSRTGKGTSLLIPNLLIWPGPAFVIDPKGENARITATRRGTREQAQGSDSTVRRFLGQAVYALDPYGVVDGPAKSCRTDYNPLADLDPSARSIISDISAYGEAIILQAKDEHSRHFTSNAVTLFRGLVDYLLSAGDIPPQEKTLPKLRILATQADFSGLMERLAEFPTMAGAAERAGRLWLATAADERSGFLSTLTDNLEWVGDLPMRDHLAARSSFSLRRAVAEGATVYVTVPEALISDQKRWLRLITNIFINEKQKRLFQPGDGFPTLAILDEFPTLGHFERIERSAGVMAGYGLKIWPIIQNIGQLQDHYERNWETFLGNAGVITAHGVNDKATEEYVSRRLGRVLYEEQREEEAAYRRRARMPPRRRMDEVLRPEEVRELTARETSNIIALPADGRPLLLRRQPYWRRFSRIDYDHPRDIARRERRDGER